MLAEALQLWPRGPRAGALRPLLCHRPSCPLCAHSQAVLPSSSPGPAPPAPGQQHSLLCSALAPPAASESIPGATLQRDREGKGGPWAPHPIRAGPHPAWRPWACEWARWDRALWEIWGNWVYRESKEGKGQSLGEKREVSSLTWGLSPGPETTGGPSWCGGRRWACWFLMARAWDCP